MGFKMTQINEKSLEAESTKLTTSNQEQIINRSKLWQEFRNCQIPDPELERSLGLFIRGSLLARILSLSEIYKSIVKLPGQVFDIGTWRGQNAVLSENFRSIYEPFNKQRKIVCFDTFTGYTGWSSKDKKSESYNENTYSTQSEYNNYLNNLLTIHEKNNALGHLSGNHKVIKGNASVTVEEYLKTNPSSTIALAYLDLGLYEPTKKVLHSIAKYLIPGSIIVLMQFTREELPGDAVAFKEVFNNHIDYSIRKCSIYPSFTIITLK